MILSWGLLVLLLLAAATVWFWQDSLAARERANAAAMEACEQLRLQFLDGTVAFSAIRCARRAGGTLTFRRTYVFDYTADSIERRQGFVVLLAAQVESVGFARGDGESGSRGVASRPGPSAPNDPGSPLGGSDNVYDLNQWRRRITLPAPSTQSAPRREDPPGSP